MVITDRRREWLETITDLKKKKEKELQELEDNKKKELAELEERKKKELEEAEAMLKAGVEELTNEEEEIIEHLKEDIPELQQPEEESLEETIAREQVPEEAKEQGPAYQVPVEDLTKAVYDQANYNVYNELRETLDKVQRGDYISQHEREEIYQRHQDIEKLDQTLESDPLFLKDKDPYGYVERAKQVIGSIEKQLQSTYKK